MTDSTEQRRVSNGRFRSKDFDFDFEVKVNAVRRLKPIYIFEVFVVVVVGEEKGEKEDSKEQKTERSITELGLNVL